MQGLVLCGFKHPLGSWTVSPVDKVEPRYCLQIPDFVTDFSIPCEGILTLEKFICLNIMLFHLRTTSTKVHCLSILCLGVWEKLTTALLLLQISWLSFSKGEPCFWCGTLYFILFLKFSSREICRGNKAGRNDCRWLISTHYSSESQ